MNIFKDKLVSVFSKGLILMTLFQFISPSLKAQDTDDDWGAIVSVGLSKKIIDKVSLSWQEEYRSREGFSTSERFAHGLEAEYSPYKFLEGGVGYIFYQYNNEDNGWQNRQRYIAFVTGDYDLGNFNIALRERYQDTQWRGNKNFKQKTYIRSRLKVKYDIKHCSFEPFASAEMYSLLYDSPSLNNNWRYEIGSKYKINKHNKLDFHLRYTTSGVEDVGNEGKICVGYTYDF